MSFSRASGIVDRHVLALRVSGVVLAMTCALVAGLGARGFVAPADGALVCGASWGTVPSAPQVENPQAIAPISKNDVWIVGNRGLDGGAPRTGAERWNGSNWTLFPTPNGGTGAENSLLGADGVAANDVWAVGYYGGQGLHGTGSYRTLVERWNGTNWELVQSPNVGTGSNALTDVEALNPNLAWAVGYSHEGKLRRSLIQRWNGSSWVVVPSPNPGTSSNTLLGITAIAADDIWAVGYKSSGAGHKPLVLHYDGVAWREVGVPTMGPEDNVLTGVSAFSDDEVWAAGYYVSGARHRALTLHHDGTSWKRVPRIGEESGVSVLHDVGVFSPTDAWAVGMDYRPAQNKGNFVASTQHWDGTGWTQAPSAIARTGAKSEMSAVGKAPGASRVWAAGPTSNVENICPQGGSTATTAPARATTETADTPDSSQPPELQGPDEAAVPEVQAASPTDAIAVKAVDKAADAGISELTRTRGAVISDFDGDGLKDIFLGRHQYPARLYANDGRGRFTQSATFVRTDRHGCDAADVNRDGLKDVYCTVEGARGLQAKHNELYVQRPDHTFVDQAEQYGILEPYARGRSGTFVNANGDAFPDLFVTNYPYRADGLPSPNRLFVNQGGTSFRYAPEFGLEKDVGGGSPTGGNPDAVDLDRDGWQDLLVETGSGLRFYRNEGGEGFTDVAASVGLGQNPTDTTVADVDGDGWPDVIEVSRSKLEVFLNSDGKFSRSFSGTLQNGVAVAAGDVNGDRRADVYAMQGNDGSGANAPDQVFLNNGSGTSFTRMSSIPSTSQGTADAVTPIDHDGNGLTDFLVQNGGSSESGPVQLVAFFPAS